MILYWLSKRARQRNRDEYLGAAASRQAGDFELAPHQGGALAHAQQSHRTGILDFLGRYAAPVVSNLQNNSSLRFLQTDRYVRCPSMADDIRQHFLEHPEKSSVQLLR